MERKGKLVSKKYREYFLATLFMSGSISIASVVDKIMIGNILGSVELAAANATNSVISSMQAGRMDSRPGSRQSARTVIPFPTTGTCPSGTSTTRTTTRARTALQQFKNQKSKIKM